MPDTPEAQARLRGYLASATPVSAAAVPEEPRQQAMDDLRQRFEGPYRVANQSVIAAPMFRLNIPDAFNARQAKQNAPRLHAICHEAGVSAAVMARCQIGRATPAELVKVTQALIDAGELASPGSAATIRQVHAFEVDSSWGADDGQPYGGVRRDTWLYNERSGTWAWLNPKTAQLEISARGPQGENFVGSFRPRGGS